MDWRARGEVMGEFEVIRLFGFDFRLAGNRYLLDNGKPDYMNADDYLIDIRPGTGSAKNIRIERFSFKTVDGIEFKLLCPFEVRFKQQGNVATPYSLDKQTSILFRFGSVASSHSALGLDLNLGPLRLVSEQCFLEVAAGGDGYRDIWVRTHQSHSQFESESLPLSIIANLGTYIRLFNVNDDNKLLLEMTHNPLTLITKLGHSNSLLKRWQLSDLNLDVAQLKDGATLNFNEDKRDAMPLYLHPFVQNDEKQQHTLASIGLDTQQLTVVMARGEDDSTPLQINGLNALPKPSGYLHSYGLVANTQRGYHRWKVSKPVALAIRTHTSDMPTHAILLQTATSLPVSGETNHHDILGLRREVKLTTREVSNLGFSTELVQLTGHHQVGSAIAKSVTTPYFNASLSKLLINRPGIALRRSNQSTSHEPDHEIRSWEFEPTKQTNDDIAFPLCPDEAMPDIGTLSKLHQYCNTTFKTLQSDNVAVTHESQLTIDGKANDSDLASKPTLPSLFRPLSEDLPVIEEKHLLTTDEEQSNKIDPAGSMAAPGLGAHISRYNYGNYVVTREWQEGEVPEYVPLIVDASGHFVEKTMVEFNNAFSMDPNYAGSEQDIQVKELTAAAGQGLAIKGSENRLIGVAKLGKEMSLLDIFEKENIDPIEYSEKEKGDIREQLSSKLKAQSWNGLVLFEQALDLSQFTLLESLIPEGALKLRYVGLSPERALSNGKMGFSTYGLAVWKNPKLDEAPKDPPEDSSQELKVQMVGVEVTWAARQLVRFFSETRVDIRSFAGARKIDTSTGNPALTRINIFGGIDKETGIITFLAQAQKPVPLLKEGVGPLKQVYVKQIEITRTNNRTEFHTDGNVDLQPFNLGDMWEFEQGDKVRFNGLKFSFLERLKLDGSWLKLDYPSLQFEFAKGWKLLDLDGINLEVRRIGYDREPDEFDWGELVQINWPGSWNFSAIRLGIQLNLGKLPFLSDNPFEELIFDFELAIPYRNGFTDVDFGNSRFGLRALGFNKLDLKLMRFLELSAEKVMLEKKDTGLKPLWLFLQGLKLKVLDKTLIEDLTFGHYWAGQQKGFVGLLNDDLVDLSILKIDWLLAGRNLRLNGNNNDDLLKEIVSIQPSDPAGIKKAITKAYKSDALLPETGGSIGEWVFAAGFSLFNEFLNGKFLFQDGAYYGLAIDGPFLKKWFGYELAISVLYIIKDRPEEDLFRLALRVPSVELGGFSFNAGVIVIEIQMNGSFLLDIGYPWLASNGERLWERGFGVMIAGLMGRGGCFIAKRSSLRTGSIGGDNPGKLTLLEGGQATMVGIGKSFSAGPLRVRAYAGIYYTCEGGMLFFSPENDLRRLELVGLRLSGSIGIQARGIAELNWWVISIRVEVVAGAEARLTLFWGALEHHKPGTADLPATLDGKDSPIGVRVDFVLYARVSARACIGSGWFKICKGISVGISMPYRTTLYLS